MSDDDLDLVEMDRLLGAVERRLNGGPLVLVTAEIINSATKKAIYYRGYMENAIGLLVWGKHSLLNEDLTDPEEGLGT